MVLRDSPAPGGMDDKIDSRRAAMSVKARGTSIFFFLSIFCLSFFSIGCGQSSQDPEKSLMVGMVLDTGGDNDHGYNEYSLLGARKAALTAGIGFEYLVSESREAYTRNIDTLVHRGADLVITIGFTLADATARAAGQYPDRHFVIMDYAYSPGQGCVGEAVDCYTAEGGLGNVTSIVFQEDQPAYLGGVLAACMSDKGVIGIVAGERIPPVLRLVHGFESGVYSIRPEADIHITHIPDFNDMASGYAAAMDFIARGADILFCPAGRTGLGGLQAAREKGVKAIGVDVDQYLTVPDARTILITSVMKNVDVAAGVIVNYFAAGRLKPGIHVFDLKSDAVGLAPYHEWEGKIPQKCTDLVARANKTVVNDPGITLPRNR